MKSEKISTSPMNSEEEKDDVDEFDFEALVKKDENKPSHHCPSKATNTRRKFTVIQKSIKKHHGQEACSSQKTKEEIDWMVS